MFNVFISCHAIDMRKQNTAFGFHKSNTNYVFLVQYVCSARCGAKWILSMRTMLDVKQTAEYFICFSKLCICIIKTSVNICEKLANVWYLLCVFKVSDILSSTIVQKYNGMQNASQLLASPDESLKSSLIGLMGNLSRTPGVQRTLGKFTCV